MYELSLRGRSMSLVAARIKEFLEEYGERAALILRSALEVSDEYKASGKNALGDFDYKGLVQKLKLKGINYNPSPLLRKLEREYGIIETTYKSEKQHWWKFIDEEAIRDVLEGEEDIEDPKLIMLKVQTSALGIGEIKDKLKKLASKKKLNAAERKWFKNFAFETLPLIVRIVEVTIEEGYEDPELMEAIKVLKLSMKVANKLKARNVLPLEIGEEINP